VNNAVGFIISCGNPPFENTKVNLNLCKMQIQFAAASKNELNQN
jgi:hypothetical protein